MRHTLLTTSLALALGLCAQPSHAALPAGISGSWFNPAQPGHGLSIEMLDGGSALAYWFVYDGAGNPLHLYIEGAVRDDTIVGTAYTGRGMRFGEFDPADHTLTVWGEVEIAFADCDSASLEWNGNGPAGAGYGTGSIPLNRLTHIAGLGCEDSAIGGDGLLAAGKYAGALRYPDSSLAGALFGAVDRSGRLWATQNFTPTRPYVGPLSLVFVGAPQPSAGALDVGVHGNYALAHPDAAWGLLDIVPVTGFDGSVQGVADVLDSTRSFELSKVVARTDPLARTISVADLAGLNFEFTARSQFFLHDHQVRFLEDGGVCIDTHLEDCYLQGTYAAEDPGLSMVSFTGEAEGAVYRGKAWVEFDVSGTPGQLVMVGVSDTPGPMTGVGLGLVADSVD